jgi:hypothetical protein
MTNFIDKANVNFNLIKSLHKKLRRYNFESKMEFCRKISHVIDPFDIPTDIEKSIFKDFNQKWLNKYLEQAPLFEIQYLALASIVMGEWDGPLDEVEYIKDFKALSDKYRKYCAPFAHKDDLEKFEGEEDEREQILKVIDTFFLRLGFQQLKPQKRYFEDLYRYKTMFETESKEINIKEIFMETYGYSYEDFVKFITLLFILSARTHRKLNLDLIRKEVKKCTNFKIEKMLELLSISREEVFKEYHKWKSNDDRLCIYNYNPLTKKPILIENDNIYIPCPQLLFKSITEGFYHELCDKKRDINLRTHFGKEVFEPYVHNVLKWDDNDYDIIPEFKFTLNGSEAKSPDFILVNGNEIIIMEIKSSTPSIQLRSSDIETYKQQLYKAYGVGLKQSIKKEEKIKEGILEHEKLPPKITKTHFLIITLEEFFIPNTEYMYNQLNNICQEAEIDFPEEIKFHFMGVERLEKIIELDSRSIFQFVNDREGTCSKKNRYIATNINNDVPITEARSAKFWLEKVAEIIEVLSKNEN